MVLEEAGRTWIGCDISRDMLDVAQQRQVAGDLILDDIGRGLPFRVGSFDGTVSTSAEAPRLASTLWWTCGAPRLSLTTDDYQSGHFLYRASVRA